MTRIWIPLLLLPSVAAAEPSAGKLQYARDVQPILSAHCFTCHGPDANNRKAGLRLDSFETATKELRSGNRAIVPGRPEKSALVERIHSDGKERMPPPKMPKGLSAAEKVTLKRWIGEGAEYQRHWAFVPPVRPAVPKTTREGWGRNPIDRFVLAKLEKLGLSPSPEADRYTLARRVALDLTGLPPSLESVDRFVLDKRPDAYERFVDEVLKSPAYGERWAAMWLDLARYADSNGYAEDQPRTIWKYRDWVIDAFNRNLPYDRFTIEQIAGDLLPNATVDQLLATAFHRNTLTNTEGGTNDEEFRNIAVVDRVNTTLQVWMSVTVNCAQCHDHKYDPISQEEFYRLFAIFNQSEDSDKSDNRPNLMYLSPEDTTKKSAWDAELAKVEKQITDKVPDLVKRQQTWEKETVGDRLAKLPANLQTILRQDQAKRKPEQKAELTRYFRGTLAEIQPLQKQASELTAKLATVQPVPTPIMRDLPEKERRVTKVHIRGDWLNLGKEVTPGVPAAFHPLSKAAPANRLGLAEWLVSAENPLTARVAVNRFWDQLFGVSLVETPEDFGMRSKPPIHPELLDYLASEFAGSLRWDVKKLLKLMVTSATYRQSSKVTPELIEKDPSNLYFARGARFRVPAEVIRDQALAIAGLLSPKMMGPSVRPPQPKLGLSAAFGPGTDWATSAGEDKYRRGLYTSWRRATPYPSMVAFDAPGKSVCALTRPRTNTPLQALVTLNDPVYVEAAQALGRKMIAEGGKTVEDRLRYGFRRTLVRPPQPAEMERLVRLEEQLRSKYRGDVKEATVLATEPLGPLPAGVDSIDAATYTVVANVLLNLDETFVKR
jgi:hypothetical protein